MQFTCTVDEPLQHNTDVHSVQERRQTGGGREHGNCLALDFRSVGEGQQAVESIQVNRVRIELE